MRSALSLLLALLPAVASAQQQDIQRALIQRDQQSAQFAAQLHGGIEARRQLELLHEEQLRDARQPPSVNPDVAQTLLPYERQKAAQSSGAALRFNPPVEKAPAAEARPSPLPGGLPAGVEPIAAPSVGG